LDLARALGFPIEIDERKLKKLTLKHWSWIDLLTEAIVSKEYRRISDRTTPTSWAS